MRSDGLGIERGRRATSRRDFVRCLGGAGAVAAAGSLPACDGESTPAPGVGGTGGEALPLTRPLLRGWADDIVRISVPVEELPVAYVSMAQRHVYVDYEFRDRAAWLLDAHISVSTAHWRIPLPGDPPGQPITPGDSMREFEELNIHEWDVTTEPAMDDIRIVRGRRVSRRVEFDCAPMAGVAWYRAGPWPVDVAAADVSETTREDFRVVGTGLRFGARECAGAGDAVQYVMWACRDE